MYTTFGTNDVKGLDQCHKLLVQNNVTVGQLYKYLCKNIDHNPSSFFKYLAKDLQLKQTEERVEKKTTKAPAKKKDTSLQTKKIAQPAIQKQKATPPPKKQSEPKKKRNVQGSPPRNTHPMPTRSKRKAEGTQQDTEWAQLAPAIKKTKR